MNRKKRRRRRLLVLCLLLLVLALALLLQLRISPYVREVAENQVVNAASNALTAAVTEQLRTGQADYNNIIMLEKDVSGNITAITTNMGEVAQLKAEIFDILGDLAPEIQTLELGIPIGSLILPDFFAGKGFRLPVRVVSLSTSGADLFTEFVSAGINQTQQRITLRVCIEVSILTPFGSQSADVDTDVVVAETVIVGLVPESYFEIGAIDSAYERQEIPWIQEMQNWK